MIYLIILAVSLLIGVPIFVQTVHIFVDDHLKIKRAYIAVFITLILLFVLQLIFQYFYQNIESFHNSPFRKYLLYCYILAESASMFFLSLHGIRHSFSRHKGILSSLYAVITIAYAILNIGYIYQNPVRSFTYSLPQPWSLLSLSLYFSGYIPSVVYIPPYYKSKEHFTGLSFHLMNTTIWILRVFFLLTFFVLNFFPQYFRYYLLFHFMALIITTGFSTLQYDAHTYYKDMLFKQYRISEREQDIIRLLLDGKSAPQMAEELFISQTTVKSHIKNIMKKTGADNKFGLIKLFK